LITGLSHSTENVCFLFSDKRNKHVAFQAILSGVNTLSLKKGKTVICGRVVSSVGDGYDAETSVFTVPVSGVYCFMFSSTPGSNSDDDECAAHIKLDDKNIAYMKAHRPIRSTVHAVVYAKAGQKVFPRAVLLLSGRDNKFRGYCLTTFFGVLVQPDV
jgi:hypothetical protein